MDGYCYRDCYGMSKMGLGLDFMKINPNKIIKYLFQQPQQQ